MFITKISVNIDSISKKNKKIFLLFQGKVRSQDLLIDTFVAKHCQSNLCVETFNQVLPKETHHFPVDVGLKYICVGKILIFQVQLTIFLK